MKGFLLALLVSASIWFTPARPAMAEDMPDRPAPPVSGHALATPAVQEMQRDSFANPALFWLERGQAAFAEGVLHRQRHLQEREGLVSRCSVGVGQARGATGKGSTAHTLSNLCACM